MEFRILGPLQVLVDDRPIDIAGPKLRTLLAALVLDAGRVVSKDRLFEILWGPEAPDGAPATLQSHVSHLREALEPGRAGGRASIVQAREPGYLLAADPVRDVDAERFERLAGDGSRALARGALAEAAELLHDALVLWRGEPLAEFAFAPFAQAEIARLRELRLHALEDRIEADLALGRHADVAGELRHLVTEQPLRERLWGQLMVALYRSGRQADALRAYAELREGLVEQLGIEPSPGLARLEEAILLQKPELEWEPPPVVARGTPRWKTAPTAPGDLPPDPSPQQLVETGLAAFGRRAWNQAFERLSAADRSGVLTPVQLEALIDAAFWAGHSGECIALCERLHATYLEAGDRRRAAFAAVILSIQHAFRLRTAVATGWFALSQRLLADEPECVERGYLAWVTATVLVVLGTPDPAPALESAAEVLDCAERFADRDLRAVGLAYRGYVLVHQGLVADGLPLLDEAMASAVAGTLGPLATAAVVCRTLSACVALHDYSRAAQWLTGMDRCAAEHALAGFPGDCRMHHAQVLLARGAWSEAEQEARRACGEVDDFVREHTGLAFVTVGEVLRLTGDLDGAEEAFSRADEFGRSPQPGLALVHLARGDTAAALASLRQALGAEPWNLLGRAPLLGAVVEVCLAAGDTAGAAEAAREVATIAGAFATAGLQAAADYAHGVVALADGRPKVAVAALHHSWQGWRKIGVSHQAARARLRLGAARSADGDHAGALLDVRAAQASFERLGARPDAQEAARLAATLPAGLRSRT
ncbi:MAG: BTAD domain-containing putative transcriptional regulator [Actinomycetota bacterium]